MATPNRNDLRRRTLLRLHTEANNSSYSEESNDELERSSRRSLVEVQRVLNLSSVSSINESKKFEEEEEMNDHFNICTKLYSENKINTKNVWKLHIIDVLKEMSLKSGSETLQTAGTSLAISAKVYSVRVDDVHSVGVKLASSMARLQEENNGENNDCTLTNNRPSKRRTGCRKKDTICKDPQSLLGSIPKLPSAFFSTKNNPQLSMIGNLFTNSLKMDGSSTKFILLSQESYWTSGKDPVLNNKVKYLFPLKNELGKFELCPELRNFFIDEWDYEEEELRTQETLQNDQIVFDEEGIPVAELDGSIIDSFNNNLQDESQQIEFNANIRNEIAEIQDFGESCCDNGTRSEYSYNNVITTSSGVGINRIWAGPSHWKLKFIKNRNLRFSGIQNEDITNKCTSKKKRFQPQQIKFDGLKNKSLFRKLKTNGRLRFFHCSKLTLPISHLECRFWKEFPLELMSKCKVMAVQKKRRKNPDLVAGECPLNSEHVLENSYDVDEGQGNEEVYEVPHQNFLQENVLEMPEMVCNKSYVLPASQAKKMDMKKLKTAVLVVIERSKSKVTFSSLYKELPNLITKKMKSELSAPLAFVALLHVCNEQNLQLIQEGKADFEIAQYTKII